MSLDVGYATHVRELTQNLRRYGNEITLVARIGDIRGVKVNRAYSQEVEMKGSFFRKTVQYISSLFLFFSRALLNARDVDIIYVRQAKSGFIMFIPKIIFRKKIIFEVNGIIAVEQAMYGQMLWNKILVKIMVIMESVAIKNSDMVVAVTGEIKKYIIDNYCVPENKIVVVPNAANTDMFCPVADQMGMQELREKIGISASEQVIAFVGILTPWQGVEYLIKSAPLILKEFPNARFLIVGDGLMREELIGLAEETGISDSFFFTGSVPYKEVPKYINASDVCVAPFIRTRSCGASPLKIYEYMSCGKPIVSSRISDLEFIEEQKAGMLVEPENPDEIAKTITRLLKDEKLRDKMGRNGREYVVKDHNWGVVAGKVTEVCEKVFLERK